MFDDQLEWVEGKVSALFVQLQRRAKRQANGVVPCE